MISSGFHALTLIDKTREYDQVFSLYFKADEPLSFLPGQYVHLLAPSSPPGRENVRHLSIASVPEEGLVRFTLDLAPTSEYKRKLAALEPGGKAHLFKIKGEFVLGNSPPPRVVFLSGGLGITPVRALVRQIVAENLPVEWRLVHVARGAFLFESELQALGGLQRRVRRPEVAPLVSLWTTEFPGARWYVSGSSRFVTGMVDQLKSKAIPESDLRVEDFS